MKNRHITAKIILKKRKLGTLENLLSFLKCHAKTFQHSIPSMFSKGKKIIKVTTLISDSKICSVKKKLYLPNKCPTFLQLNIQKRRELVR